MDMDTIQLDKVSFSVHLPTSLNWSESEQHPETPGKWSAPGHAEKDGGIRTLPTHSWWASSRNQMCFKCQGWVNMCWYMSKSCLCIVGCLMMFSVYVHIISIYEFLHPHIDVFRFIGCSSQGNKRHISEELQPTLPCFMPKMSSWSRICKARQFSTKSSLTWNWLQHDQLVFCHRYLWVLDMTILPILTLRLTDTHEWSGVGSYWYEW